MPVALADLSQTYVFKKKENRIPRRSILSAADRDSLLALLDTQDELIRHYTFPLAPAEAEWWRSFHDATLDRLVTEAQAQNLDLTAAAAARVDQARAAAEVAGAALLPAGAADASVERARTSLQTPAGVVGRKLDLPRDDTLYQIGGEASWEIDLFGGLRRGREAAEASFGSAQAEEAALRLAITAETADAYLQLRGLQARYGVAASQLDTERQLVGLVRQQVGQGLVPDRELDRVTGEAEGIEASLPPLRVAMAGEIDRIDILTGRQAGADPDHLAQTAGIPAAPHPRGDAQPAALLRQRPDVAAAERRLAASNARIGAALAEYYPKISLNGLFGTASVGTTGLFGGDAFQASGGGALRWRLFDFGRVDAEVAAARGREAEALAQYRQTVLRATEDVETALTRLVESRREIGIRQREVAVLTRSRDRAGPAGV